MTIGIVANSAWNIVNFRKNLITSLTDEGHIIYIIAPYEENYKNIVESLGCFFMPIHLQNKGTNPISDSLFVLSLFKLYKQAKLDLVLHFTIKPNIYGSFAAYLAKIPCVNNVTGLGTVFLHHNIKTTIAKWLYRIAFKIPQHIFFQNNDDKSLFFEENIIVRQSSTQVIPGSGIDLNHFKSNKSFSRNKPFTFLMISRLLYDKGIIEFVEAAKKVVEKTANVRFQVLGQIEQDAGLGVSNEQVEDWVNCGILEYLGIANDVRPFIEDADCVVLPSYREGTPRSLLEAASMETPIVTTNVPGCKEVVIDGYNGFLCSVKSGRSLAEKLFQILELDDVSLKKMGENGRVFVEKKFNEKLVSEAYINQTRKVEHKKRLPSKR